MRPVFARERRTLVLALLGLASLHAEPPSAADLLRASEVTRATLSPAGKHVLLVEGSETDVMLPHHLGTGQRRRVPSGSGDEEDRAHRRTDAVAA